MANKINFEQLSKNEEDYLKAVFHLTIDNQLKEVGANKLAEYLNLSPASVNSMVKKLKSKQLLNYERYGKIRLSAEGETIAISLIRKHRIWETFLYEHLNFTWDEVHEVAEQLEHIRSEKLISELDAFLGKPKLDPHGDVIPDANGVYEPKNKKTLSEMDSGKSCKLIAVKDGSVQFLQYLSSLELHLKTQIKVLEKRDFDKSMTIEINGKPVNVSKKFSENLYVL